jgi:hypothetical protein
MRLDRFKQENDLRALLPIARFCAAVSLLALAMPGASAQEPSRQDRLDEELAQMDRELFDAAFVKCDQAKFSSLFTDDAEFYHDRTGATYGDDVKQLRSCPRDNGVTRTLVPGSLKVYPIKEFGAIQMGRHTFTREGEPGVEIAKFVHLWKLVEGKWRLARVMSFDHRPMTDQDESSVREPRP